MTWLNLIALLCAATAWLVSRRAPQHRPVGIALTICTLLDVVRSVVPLPPRVDMALCLGAPAVSAWCYARVWRYPSGDTWQETAIVWATLGNFALWAPDPLSWWDKLLPLATGMAVLTGVLAIGFVYLKRYQTRRQYPRALFITEPWTVTQHTAAMLLAGDVAGLLLLVRRDWVHYQAGVVLALVARYQVWWVWRYRYGKYSE